MSGETQEDEQPTTDDPIQQAAATFAKLGFNGAVSELASHFKPEEYDRVRRALAGRLGIRTVTLDRAYDQARGLGNGQDQSGKGQAVGIEDPEPWHEPVDGPRLVAEIENLLNRHLVLPDHAATAITLWIIFTYVYDGFRVCPMLMVESPQKRCGKTTLLAILLRACYRPLSAANISPSALYRVIEKWSPTLIIDEADTFVRDNEELRGLLNCGHTREFAYTLRNVEINGQYEPYRFSTWGPKAIAAIGALRDTLVDRSIVIKMRRKKRSEARERLTGFEQSFITERCSRWAQDNATKLRVIDVEATQELHDRAVDNWIPLLTIASCIGGEWPERARKAAVALTESDSDGDSIAVQLLSDIRDVLTGYRGAFIPSKELASYLVGLEDRPWAEYSRGRPITPAKVSRMLRGFGVRTGKANLDTRGTRGYDVSSFRDPFDRYLSPLQSAETPQRNNGAASSDCQSAAAPVSTALSNPRKPTPDKGCGTSALSQPQNGGLGEIGDARERKVI